MTSRDPKAVEPVDDQEEESMMCWLQYVLPQFWARLALVTPMYPPPFFPHAVVANIPYILPIIPELFFSLFASYYSQIIPVVADIPVYSSDYSGIML